MTTKIDAELVDAAKRTIDGIELSEDYSCASAARAEDGRIFTGVSAYIFTAVESISW